MAANAAVDATGSRLAISTSAGGFGWALADLHGDPAGYVAAAGGVVTDAARYDPYGEVSGQRQLWAPLPLGLPGSAPARRRALLESVAVARPGLAGQRPLPVDQEVPEPVPDLDEVLGATERRAGPRQLVGLADAPA